jgi:hypothetical protein
MDNSTAANVTGPQTGRCDPMRQEQTDLSGTYTGKVNYPEASLTGNATLTITGNNFSLAAGSTTQSGRVTAVTTCGYTGVTMMFGDLTPPTPSPNPPAALPAFSLRAKKMGDRVILMTVPGEKRSFSFASPPGNDVPLPDVKSGVADPSHSGPHHPRQLATAVVEVLNASFKDDIDLKTWLIARAKEHKRLRMIIPKGDSAAFFVLERVRRRTSVTYSVIQVSEALDADRLYTRIGQNSGATFVGVYPINQSSYLIVFYGR